MMFPALQFTNSGERADTRDSTSETSNTLRPNCPNQNSDIYHSNRTTLIETRPMSSLRLYEVDKGIFGDGELWNRKGKAVLDNTEEYEQSGKEKVGMHSRYDSTPFGIVRPDEGTSVMNHEKATMQGSEGCLYKLETVTYAHNIDDSHNYGKEFSRTEDHRKVSADRNSMLPTYGTPKKLASWFDSLECRTDAPLNTVEERSDDRMTHNLTIFSPIYRACSDSRGKSEFGMMVALHTEDIARGGAWHTLRKDDTHLVLQPSHSNLESLNKHKGKEHIWSIEQSVDILEREGRDDSVGSSNSSKSVSTNKRSLNPDLTTSSSKRRRNGESSSGTLIGERGSFMNWISAITRGYTRSDLATPLAFRPHSSPNTERRNVKSIPMSNDKDEDHDASGFKSIFQAISECNFSLQKSGSSSLGFPKDVDGSGHEAANEQDVRGNLHNRVLTSREKHKQGTCQVEELLLPAGNITPMRSTIYHTTNCNTGQTCSSTEMRLPSSPAIVPEPCENKGSPPHTGTNEISLLENLWIKRLLPKVSAPEASQMPCNLGMESANKKLKNNHSMLSTHVVCSAMEKNSSGNFPFLSLEGLRSDLKDENRGHFIALSDSYVSDRINGQKIKSSLNTILPSQRFKKSEQVAPLFAKKLDAFRQIRSPTISSNAVWSTTICFFCGKAGHRIQQCSEVDETELGDLMENINIYSDALESSCLCIRCLQFNHWAVLCPHSSSQRKNFTDNAFVVRENNCNRVKNKHESPISSNYDGRTIFLSKGGQESYHGCNTVLRGNTSVEAELLLISDIAGGMGKVVDTNSRDRHAKAVKKLKQTCPSSMENKLKENKINQSWNLYSSEENDHSVAIFERMRRLRLSRTDIIRWMTSPISHVNLEGFFLRLWLGQCDEGLERKGYHVARINGVSCESSLSVCIAGSTYLVDCCSVSNHDFIEDELQAWWSANLKSGGKTPSIEEMNQKLQDRMKFGL